VISGRVNADLEAVIGLTVVGPRGQQHNVQATVDTGYDGWLTLPSAVVRQLHLRRRGRERGALADGTEILVETYYAMVMWEERQRAVVVDMTGDVPLLGMASLDGYELTIRVVEGGAVKIVSLASP